MGGAFLGPFVAGLSGTLQQAQQRQTEQEYKKALVEHSKLQTKLLENQLAQKDALQGLMAADMASRGYAMPPPQPTQMPQPEQQPQSLLGRIFNPQLPPSQPTSATQPPLPQAIAQGQMQGQIPGMRAQGQPDEAFMKDLKLKMLYDMQPFYQRLQEENKQVGRTINTIGPNGQPITILVDKMGNVMNKAYPTPAEPYRQQVTTPQGTYMYELPKYGSGGVGGPVMQTAPPEMERTKIKTNFGDFEVMQPKYGAAGTTTQIAPAGEGMTSEKAGKINLIGNAIERSEEAQKLAMPNGVIDRELLLKAKPPLIGKITGPILSGTTLYSKMYQSMEAALRMETGQQANPDEIKNKVLEFWPNPQDPDAVIKEKFSDFNNYINGAANVIDPTGELRKIRKTGNVPTGTAQGKPSLNLGGGITAQQVEQEYQQALRKRPDLAPQLKAKRDQLMQQVR